MKMPGKRTDPWKWLLLLGLFSCSSCQSGSSTFENKTGQTESKPRVFSPRMDYDEWTPLGRGDPLKNNPTFDYVPPVLDRVQYWLDSHTTEASAKRDILVLGVTAKKTSPKIPEQFLKFVDGPKFTRSNQQDVSYRTDFTGSTGAEPPKLVRTSNFRNGPSIDYRNQNRIQSIPASYYPSPFYDQKTKPYTMMLPPPPVPQKGKLVSFAEPTQQFNTQTEEGPVLQESQFYAPLSSSKRKGPREPGKSPGQTSSNFPPSPIQTISQVETIKSVFPPSSPQPTRSKYETITTPSVSFEKSNLIYQSTETLSGGWSAAANGAASASVSVSVSTPDSRTPDAIRQAIDYSRDRYEIDHHIAAASSNHEVVVEQNANIIVDGDSNENEEVVVGQKGGASSASNAASPAATTVPTLTTPSLAATDANSSFSSSLNDETRQKKPEQESLAGDSSEKMHIVVANSPATFDAEANEGKKVAVVMPTNYFDNKSNQAFRNSESPKASTEATTASSSRNSTTTQTEAASEDSAKMESQPVRNSASGTPIYSEDSAQASAGLPNRLMPVHQQHAMHSHSHSTMNPFASRHPVDSMVGFAPPQAPLSSLMHPQPRPNHGTMQFLGSMRPSVDFRAPASMVKFPPMTHMYAPPPPPLRSSIGHMASSIIMDHAGPHRAPPQPPPPPPLPPQMQNFPAMFVDSPAPSTLIPQPAAKDHSFDRYRPRLPETTTALYTTPTTAPFVPTASPSLENSPPTIVDSPAIEASPEKTMSATETETEIETEKREEDEADRSKKTSASTQITTVPSLTTDPIFSHYKQPAKPIRGPMYLIIQGHSKVKTYKPTVSKHGIPMERNEILKSATDRQLSKFEQFVQENTKSDGRGGSSSAIEKKKAEEKARAEKLARARQDDLMSLVDSGLASFTVSPTSSSSSSSFSSATEAERDRSANSFTTVEVNSA